MKLISLFLLTLFLGKGCGGTDTDMESAVVDYTANTRGFYQHIIIANHEISVAKQRGDQDLVKRKIADADWNALVSELSKLNLDALASYKAPTEKRFHDGAAMADLKITYKNQQYQSTTFDHGTPPTEIAAAVNQIVALANKP